MRYYSTRSTAETRVFCTLDQALNSGLAPDGGLYVPETLPNIDFSALTPAWTPDWTLAQTAAVALRPFFEQSRNQRAGNHESRNQRAGEYDSVLAPQLEQICAESLNLPMPQVPLQPASHQADVLELFHGPTAAFKDFAARFLAACLMRLQAPGKHSTVLVATSGDTGGAVAAAFHEKPGFAVKILYPDGRVSARQAHQLGAFGGNVQAYRLRGSFDDCQALVKQAFSDPQLRSSVSLISANSISLGRLLPQMAYYVDASLRFAHRHGCAPALIIPSGNLGHGLGALMARSLGAPIAKIVLACNENDVLARYFAEQPARGEYRPLASKSTLANAMDVGNPSNFERLQHLFGVPDQVSAFSASDHDIRRIVHTAPQRYGQVLCPHTACAVHAFEQLRLKEPATRWLIAATAHPAKFDEVVDTLLHHPTPVPDLLAQMLRRPATATPLDNAYSALRSLLQSDAD